MAFDVAGFAQGLMGLRKPQDLLDHARAAAASVAQQPSFACHVQPGRGWEHATIASSRVDGGAPLAAVRSALYAVHRRLSLAPRTQHIERMGEVEPMFRALLPGGSQLTLVPMRNRSGRLTGALVAGQATAIEAAAHVPSLQTIADLTGLAMETAWLHAAAVRDQERLQLFSTTAEESFWDWNLDADDVWWGGNIEPLFGGVARGSMRADWRRTRIHPEDSARVVPAFDAALRSKASSWSDEYRLHDVAGKVVHVREHVYFLREAEGQAHRAIGTVRNITALKTLLLRETEARAEAELASRYKDEFLAMLGHELRNPLAPIVAVLTLLERRADAPDRQLQILRRQTQHLVRLVDDLLDVSRISSGKVELSIQRVAIGPLIHRAVEMMQPLLEQRRHSMALDLDETLTVNADAARLTQVVSNLLANAAKYTEPGGRIKVTAAAKGNALVLTVRDTGIGIAPEVLPTIFDLFTQAKQAIDRAQGGLGLGLSIVKNIVKLHGGSVQAQSEGLGKGTTVTVRIPLAAALNDVAEISPAASASGPPRELLVVDDNEDAAAVVAELLSEFGHTVRVAFHPLQALQLFAAKAPDLALVDIGLPSMDGYELARRLRSLPGGTQAKLVALTGYGSAADRKQALAAGFDEHMAKPVEPERLERLIAVLTSPSGT